MTELKREELMKSRGYSATLSAGYHLFADNFKAFFRHLWPFAAVIAVLFAITRMLTASIQERLLNGEYPAGLGLAAALFGLLSVAAYIVFYSRIYTMLNGQTLKWNAGRILKVFAFLMLIVLVVGCIITVAVLVPNMAEMAAADPEAAPAQMPPAAGLAVARSMVLVLGLYALCCILMLPFVYLIMKYMMEPDARLFPTLLGKYGRGLRHAGYIFVVMLLLGLCMMVVGIFVSLPMIITEVALNVSQSGLADGDDSGMPGSFFWIHLGVTAVTYFVIMLISVVTTCVNYYIYGSIETRRREKEQLGVAVMGDAEV